MTDILCGYANRDETIVAFLYDELEPGERRDFNAHLLTCTVCRDEVAGLRAVRTQLARWEPPALTTLQSPVPGTSRPAWWHAVPAWAQVAAALLFLGVSAGIANLDVRYDQNGLNITTGWSKPGSTLASDRQSGRPPASPTLVTDQSTAGAPWRADLATLERQLRTELRASQASAPAQAVHAVSSSDAETLRRVRALLDESEKRQQRELALRIAEVVRDVDTQRRADLRNIDHTLGLVRNDLGVEVMKQRQSLNLLYRASQRQ
jgi:Putative zinc-finger